MTKSTIVEVSLLEKASETPVILTAPKVEETNYPLVFLGAVIISAVIFVVILICILKKLGKAKETVADAPN